MINNFISMNRIKKNFISFVFILVISFYFILNYMNLSYSQNKLNRVALFASGLNSTYQQSDILLNKLQSNNDIKRIFKCYDHSNVRRATFHCDDNIDIEMVAHNTERVDFEVFLDRVGGKKPNKTLRPLYMVYSMESEPHIGFVSLIIR